MNQTTTNLLYNDFRSFSFTLSLETNMESANQAIHSLFSGTAAELHLLTGKL